MRKELLITSAFVSLLIGCLNSELSGNRDTLDLTPEDSSSLTMELPSGVPLEFIFIPSNGKSFWISKHEVTQEQWNAVMQWNPSSVKCNSSPVDSVSWHEAVEFCRKASELTGHNIQLPLSEEWSIASKSTKRHIGRDGHATGNTGAETTDRSRPRVDAVFEGVREWCADWFKFESGHGPAIPLRIIRVGSPSEGYLEETGFAADSKLPFIGFRVATGGDELTRYSAVNALPPRARNARLLIVEPLLLSDDHPSVRSQSGALLQLLAIDKEVGLARIQLNSRIIEAHQGEKIGGLRFELVTDNQVLLELTFCQGNEP